MLETQKEKMRQTMLAKNAARKKVNYAARVFSTRGLNGTEKYERK